MDAPKISVVVPVYNTYKYLSQCLDSILAQTFKDYEIVIVDDGSTDGKSPQLVDEYASRHESIRVIHQKNMGLSEARHTGINAARGEYVYPLDSDDWLREDALQLMYDEIQNGDFDLVVPNFYQFVTATRGRVQSHNHPGEYDHDGFLELVTRYDNDVPIASVLSRRSLWHEDSFVPSQYNLPSEDYLTDVLLAKYVNKAKILTNAPIYYYRLNPNSLSSTGTLAHRQELWQKYFEVMRQSLEKQGVLSKYEQNVRIYEVEKLSFHVTDIEAHQEWYQQIMTYPYRGMPLRHKLLLTTIRFPKIHKLLLATYRKIKFTLLNRDR